MRTRYIFMILFAAILIGVVASSPWNSFGINDFQDTFDRPNNASLGPNWTHIANTGDLNASIIDNFLKIEDKVSGGQVNIEPNSSVTNVNGTHRFIEFRINVSGSGVALDKTHNIALSNENLALLLRFRINDTRMDVLSGSVIDGSDSFIVVKNTFYNISLDLNWSHNKSQWSVDGVPIGNLTFQTNSTRLGRIVITTGDPTTIGNLTIDYIQWGNGTTSEVMVQQNSPVDNFNTIDSNITFDCNATGTPLNLTNASLLIDGVRNFTNTTSGETISLLTEVEGLSVGTHTWSCQGINNVGVTGTSGNRTFTIPNFAENSQTFNTTTFETAQESFSLNITFNSTEFTSITAVLNYNGTGFLGSRTGTGDSAIFTSVVQIPTLTNNENKSFNWELNLTNSSGIVSANSTISNQFVSNIVLGLCNGTITTPYINFTFKNETVNQEDINATITSTWDYSLGDGSVNNTLSFANSTENVGYDFCFTPGDRLLNIVSLINYNNVESQQRTFSLTSILSNVTTNQVLFLLPTISGLFGQFRTESTTGNILAGVQGTISRVLGGSTITVASAFTDSSGLVVYFLNPDVTYTGTFTLSGFNNNVFNFVPVTDLRVVIMGGGVGTGINGTEISLNTSYQISPSNNSLNNNTDFVFSFNVTSAETVTLMTMNITNSSGDQIGFQTLSGQGLISQTINTGNNSRISGIFTYQTGSETITLTKTWIVGDTFIGDYSIFRQLTLYLDYQFTDFIRLLIVISLITSILIFMSIGELTDTSESKIAVSLLLIWGFSIVGWLDNPTVVAQTGIAEFSKQYGIAILSTAGGLYFILRRLFIRRI